MARVPEGAHELERIFSSLDPVNKVARQLFREKYLVFLKGNPLPWKIRRPNPLRSVGDSFETCFVLFGARRKRRLAGGSSSSFLDGSFGAESSYSPGQDSLDSSVFESTDPRSPRRDVDCRNYRIHLVTQKEVQDLLKLCTWLGDRNGLRYPAVVFGENGTNMSLMTGVYRTEDGKRLRFSVVNPGTVLELEDVPKYEKEVKSHLRGFRRNTPVTVDAFAQFKIPFVKGESQNTPCKWMDVDLECYWDGVKRTFEPPSVNGTFFVNLRCIDGDDETGASAKFRELKIVTALRESMDSGLMKWSPRESGSVLEQLEAFVADEKNSLLRKNIIPRDENTYASFESAVVSQRKHLDFVEKLWLILKDSSSSEELVDAFTYVYGKLNEFIKAPYVHSGSAARVARDAASVGRGSARVPSPDVRSAIQMLLQMGVEKLRRDYETLLHGFDFASLECLRYFSRSDLTSAESVTSLKMLHVIVELSYVCFKALQFPRAQLTEFVRSGLEYFRRVEAVDSKHVFCRPVPAEVALAVLNTQLLPSIWEVSLSSSEGKYRKQSVVRLTKMPRPQRFSTQSGMSKTFKDSAYIFYRSTLIEDEL